MRKKSTKAKPATTAKHPGRPRYAETSGRTVEGGKAPKRTYRMVDEEYALVKQAADAAGKPISTFTREALLVAARKLLE